VNAGPFRFLIPSQTDSPIPTTDLAPTGTGQVPARFFNAPRTPVPFLFLGSPDNLLVWVATATGGLFFPGGRLVPVFFPGSPDNLLSGSRSDTRDAATSSFPELTLSCLRHHDNELSWPPGLRKETGSEHVPFLDTLRTPVLVFFTGSPDNLFVGVAIATGGLGDALR
jgi:hypothetical protein